MKSICMILMAVSLVRTASALAGDAFSSAESRLRILSVEGRPVSAVNTLQVQSPLADAVRTRLERAYAVPGMPETVTGSLTRVQVKGRHPYTLILERTSDLGRPVVVERAVDIPADWRIQQYDFSRGGADVLLEQGEERFRLRVLHASDQPVGVQNGGPALIERRHSFRGEAGDLQKGAGQFVPSEAAALVFPSYTRQPSFSFVMMENEQDVFKSKWVNEGRTLYIEWHDQVDVFTFDVDAEGQLRFVLERMRGDHADQMVSFGLEPEEKEIRTGHLIGYWSFDELQGDRYPDVSGRHHPATVSGGIQPIAGMKGQGIYGLRCEGVPAGEPVTPDADNKVPGALQFGQLTLPREVLEPVTDAMTLTFWYRQPFFTQSGFGGYIPLVSNYEGNPRVTTQTPFSAEGFFTLYNMWHFLGGQRITANGLGNGRLFGMYGPEQPRDTWALYAIVIDKTLARIYINGELKMEVEGKQSLAEAKRSFEEIVVMRNMWGTMDELKIYDYPQDVNQVKYEFMRSQAQELVFLDFEGGLIDRGDEQIVKDARNNPHVCEGVEIVPSVKGRGLRFGPEGGTLRMPHAINTGKQLDVLTFSAWVKTPENYKDRGTFFNTQTGHSGLDVGVWNAGLWGGASLINRIGGDLPPNIWTHVIVSYGRNRLTVWLDGKVALDNPEAYPCEKGWNVQARPYVLSFDQPLELDEVRLLNFFPDEQHVQALLNSGPVIPPELPNPRDLEKTLIRAEPPQ